MPKNNNVLNFHFKLVHELKYIVILVLVLPSVVCAQIGDYQKYSDISSSEFYSFNIEEDIKYGVGKTNYQKLNESGSYDLVNQINLELDLFVPNVSLNEGKRAVIIMIPSGGRSGCRSGVRYLENDDIDTYNGCDKETLLSGAKVTQEGANFNHLNNSIASQYAKRGFIVASVNTRYTYQHSILNKNGSNRWFRTADGKDNSSNPATLLTAISAHLEFLVVDLKRVMRWLTANADIYNIDPNYIFIDGGSGGSKMVGLSAVTNEKQLIVDDPANINVNFETANNNWGIRNSTPGIKGAILRKGNLNGNYHINLMDTMSNNTDSFMFWAGTADKSILHGDSEALEEKCEIIGDCSSQLYSLPNATHGSTSSYRYTHTKSGDQSVVAHVYDFMVNAIHRDTENLPVIGISENHVNFDESVGNAQIRIVRTGDASKKITFTVAADQMREVTTEDAKQGSFDLITQYVAKSSNSNGLVMYDDSTGYAYEDAVGGNLRKSSDRTVRHSSGKGAGEYTEISSGDAQYHNIDFTGKTQVLTMSAGQTSINFNVPIENDNLLEENECFKVRIRNAYGASIGNSVETITIKDDDSSYPETSQVCVNAGSNSGSNNAEDSVKVRLSEPSVSVIEGNRASLKIKADNVVDEDVVVSYQTISNIYSADTTDYVWVNSTAVIKKGTNSIDINIQTREDSSSEPTELFAVALTGIDRGNASLDASNSIAEITIVDNDNLSSTLDIRDLVYATESKDAVFVRFTLGSIVQEDIIINYRTIAGSAKGSKDYKTISSGQKTISAGDYTVGVLVELINDTIKEGDENFKVVITSVNTVNANIQIGNDTASIVIKDDD